jgi:hypothetical protein
MKEEEYWLYLQSLGLYTLCNILAKGWSIFERKRYNRYSTFSVIDLSSDNQKNTG